MEYIKEVLELFLHLSFIVPLMKLLSSSIGMSPSDKALTVLSYLIILDPPPYFDWFSATSTISRLLYPSSWLKATLVFASSGYFCAIWLDSSLLLNNWAMMRSCFVDCTVRLSINFVMFINCSSIVDTLTIITSMTQMFAGDSSWSSSLLILSCWKALVESTFLFFYYNLFSSYLFSNIGNIFCTIPSTIPWDWSYVKVT